MNPRIVSAGELAPGMRVTVFDTKPPEHSPFEPPVLVRSNLPDLQGHPLEVLAVDLPFVLVRHPSDQRFTLDTRRFEFMEVAPAFWAAYTARADETSNDFAELVRGHNNLAAVVGNLARQMAVLEQRLPPPTQRKPPIIDRLLRWVRS